MDMLQGFDIDLCTAAAGTPGVALLDYAGLDEVDAESWEPAINSAYAQGRAVAAQWRSMPFVVGTGSWMEDSDTDPQAPLFKNTISVFLPGDSADIRAELDRMARRRFLLRLTRRSGQTNILIGTPEQPMLFESRYESGTQGGDQRGHRCRFSGESLTKSPDYIPAF